MTQANDSFPATPGSGTPIATHLIGGKEHQVVLVANEYGSIQGATGAYRMVVNGSAVGANKVHCDLFNADATLILKVVSAKVIPDIDTAVTGVVGNEISLTRTTAVGTGGTGKTDDNTALTGISISRLDTGLGTLDADITARTQTAGGATAGAILGTRYIFTEETNAGAAIAAALGAEFIDPRYPVILRQNQGLRFVQGGVAGVGTLNFEITFEVI